MEIYERIRLLRKTHLKMTQEKFGEVLGVNRSGINNIEGNRLVKPEQKEPLYKLICKIFNVNYEWLTTGQGEIFVTTRQSFIEQLAAEYGLSLTAQKIIECYLSLDEAQAAAVDGFIMSIAESLTTAETPVEVEDKAGHYVVDGAIDKVMVYRAAKSETNTEQEIVDGTRTVEKLDELPSVANVDDF